MTTKKAPVDPANAAAWVTGGRVHRPEHQKTKEQNQQAEEPHVGRSKSFENADRLNLLLPAHMVEGIRIRALKERRTPGQLVAELLAPLFPQGS
jgi:hypothetical protein